MNVLKYNNYEGTAEVDADRSVCRGHILYIDDVVTYEAENPKDLVKEFRAAVDDYVETCQQIGKAPQKPFKGQFNVRVPPSLHKSASIRALCDGVSLNEVVTLALTTYLNSGSAVNHHLRVTIEGSPTQLQTIQTSTSAEPQWVSQNVH
jgi:predicted HicB family RNase H-like nuclease